MENLENELYICLKDKSGNFIPFYNLKGTFFSNNMKGGGNVIDTLTNIINFDQFNKNIKSQNLNNEISIPSNIELSENEEYMIENKGGSNETYVDDYDDQNSNSVIPEDFVNLFKKKLERF